MPSTRRRKPRRQPDAPQPVAAATPPSSPLSYVALFSLALVVRLAHFIFMRDAPVYSVLLCDAWEYDRWAREVAGGDWIGREVFYQTPLYPYFLAVVYTTLAQHVWAVRLVQALFGAIACVALARAGESFFSRRVGIVAGMILAVYPPAIFFDGILQKASLDLLLMAALLWLLGLCLEQGRTLMFAGAGLAIGALILNRENAVLLLPVVGAWIIWLSWPQPARVRWLRVAVFSLGTAGVLVPVGLRNYYVGGELLLTTSQFGPNFYIGNHREANGLYESLRPFRGDPRHERDDARLLAEQAEGRSLSPSEVSEYWLSRALDDMRELPGRWLRLLAYKAMLTVHRIEIVDAESIDHHRRHSPLLAGLGYLLHAGVLVPLAVFGVVLTRHDWRRLWLLYAMMLTFGAAVALFFVFARYRYPLVPLWTLFAAAGIVGVLDRLRTTPRRGYGELVIAAALALPLAVISNWPLPNIQSEDVTYFNMGTALLDADRPAEAIGPLEQAAAINPTFPAAYHNLGLAAMALDDLEDARRWFQKALELDPRMAGAYFNLARIDQRQGQLEAAIEHVDKALELDPLLAAAHQLRGRLAMQRGELEGIEHLRRAAELEPRSGLMRADVGMALASRGDLQGAIAEYLAALEIEPRLVMVENNLAWILATSPDPRFRNPAEAIQRSDRVCQATDNAVPEFLDTLAAAYAAAGDFDRALETSAHAIELAREAEQTSTIEKLESRRALYEQGQAYVDRDLAPPANSGE